VYWRPASAASDLNKVSCGLTASRPLTEAEGEVQSLRRLLLQIAAGQANAAELRNVLERQQLHDSTAADVCSSLASNDVSDLAKECSQAIKALEMQLSKYQTKCALLEQKCAMVSAASQATPGKSYETYYQTPKRPTHTSASPGKSTRTPMNKSTVKSVPSAAMEASSKRIAPSDSTWASTMTDPVSFVSSAELQHRDAKLKEHEAHIRELTKAKKQADDS
jgi:hypothetical protein